MICLCWSASNESTPDAPAEYKTTDQIWQYYYERLRKNPLRDFGNYYALINVDPRQMPTPNSAVIRTLELYGSILNRALQPSRLKSVSGLDTAINRFFSGEKLRERRQAIIRYSIATDERLTEERPIRRNFDKVTLRMKNIFLQLNMKAASLLSSSSNSSSSSSTTPYASAESTPQSSSVAGSSTSSSLFSSSAPLALGVVASLGSSLTSLLAPPPSATHTTPPSGPTSSSSSSSSSNSSSTITST